MTPKEKARELVEIHKNYTNSEWVKQLALICVDEIIKTIQPHLSTAWWQEVKEEIMKL